MILADVISDRDMTPREHDWIFIEGWSAELGLTAPEAIARVTGSPDRRTPGMADPEAAG